MLGADRYFLTPAGCYVGRDQDGHLWVAEVKNPLPAFQPILNAAADAVRDRAAPYERACRPPQRSMVPRSMLPLAGLR